MKFITFVESKKKYDYSSVLYHLPKKISKSIYGWGLKHVKDKEIYKDPEDPTFGREDDIHCTVIYGMHDDRIAKISHFLKNTKPFTIKLDKITSFTTSELFDVLKIDVVGKGLHDLHEKIKNNFECTISFPEYKPHVTIAYLKKGEAKKHVGCKDFLGETMTVDSFIFSSHSGTKIKINTCED